MSSGAFLALWLARSFLSHPAELVPTTEEGISYVGRLLDFREQLAAGYLAPQWSTSMRGGMGSAHFSYYQPGFFYVASLASWIVQPVRALGVAVAVFALAGYWGTFVLVSRPFGRLAGWLAGSSLLLAAYPATNVFIRGDLGEFAAMMMAPAALASLAGWFDVGQRSSLVGLALACAAIILLHPAVALGAYAVLTAAAAIYGIHQRQVSRSLAAIGALLAGAALVAHYWLPVCFEWHLVATEQAFLDYYDFHNHFVRPWALLGYYDRGDVIPFALGEMLVVVSGFHLIAVCRRWKEVTPSQRRLVLFALAASLLLTFMMSSWSCWIWEAVRPLQRMQFPWRLMSLLTVTVCVLAGASLPWVAARHRTVAAIAIVAAMFGFSTQYTRYRIDPEWRAPQTVSELTAMYFAPDGCDEWLPRGATTDIPSPYRAGPMGEGGCQAGEYRREAGRLVCRVWAEEPASVVLPHYYFAVGWRAALDGRELPLTAGPFGLMRVTIPPADGQQLTVRFRYTPMRRLGLAIGGMTWLLGIGGLLFFRRRRAPWTPTMAAEVPEPRRRGARRPALHVTAVRSNSST